MKIVIEASVCPSRDNPEAKLSSELVTRRVMRRIQNADVTDLCLDYEDPITNEKIKFLFAIDRFTAVEENI
jgi:hypothetical protein